MGMYKATPRLVDLYTDDNTIFANLAIPTGLQSATVNALILQECGELQTVFEDAATLKAYLAPWSAAHADPWGRMLAALSAEYNPIHNYDRTDIENITDAETGSKETSDSVSESGSGSESGSATTDVTKGDTSTIKKMGFNSTEFIDSDQTEVEATESGESTTSRSMSSETSKSGSGSEETSRNATRGRTLTSKGNIGVTTAQQMITAEIDMRAAFNMYNIIMRAFRTDICVGVW